MNTDEKYHDWKNQRYMVDIGTDFTDKVMDQIRTFEEQKGLSAFVAIRIVDWIGLHPLAQAAAIVLMTVFTVVEGALLLRIGIG